MKSLVADRCRNAAALVVLSPRTKSVSVNSGRCNYEVLLQTRGQGASFRNSVVFPGGVHEVADASADWLTLLKSFGYTQTDFNRLHTPGSSVTPIFEDNPVLRHVALRITAIRETFEELGLLICSQVQRTERKGLWACCLTDFDIKHWQNRVNKDPSELLTLCSELRCYPDIWSLHYWSNWLSPPKLKKRFDTAFFLAALQDKPLVATSSEVVKTEWQTPLEVVARSESLVIYPPQSYELHRLAHFQDLSELLAVASGNSSVAQPLFYHATVVAADGCLHVFPGDDLYPTSIDYNNHTFIKSDKSISDLREDSKTVHRIESLNDRNHTLVIKNYKSKNTEMGDVVVPIHVTFS